MKKFFILLLMANVFNLFGAARYTPSWATSKPRPEGDYRHHDAYNDRSATQSRERAAQILKDHPMTGSVHGNMADIMDLPGTTDNANPDEFVVVEAVETLQPTVTEQTSLTSLVARLKAWWSKT